MSRAADALRRLAYRLRWSMAAQIVVSIAAISMVLIVVSGFALERLFLAQLRMGNELILISNLDFVRDELVAGGFDLSRPDRAATLVPSSWRKPTRSAPTCW